MRHIDGLGIEYRAVRRIKNHRSIFLSVVFRKIVAEIDANVLCMMAAIIEAKVMCWCAWMRNPLLHSAVLKPFDDNGDDVSNSNNSIDVLVIITLDKHSTISRL